MGGIVNLFLTNRLKDMIEKYAAKPAEFFIDDGKKINEGRLKELVAKYISIKSDVRGGYACIKGTRIAVCDIVIDTWRLSNPVGYESEMYSGTITREAIDAAYAFLILDSKKANQDFREEYGDAIPTRLCR